MKSKLIPLLCITLHLCAQGAWAQVPDGSDMHLPRTPFRLQSRAEVQLPPAVDNSTRKFFPPVLDQMGGSCAQASGIGYMFTYEINRLLDRDAHASADHRFSYQFSWNLLNDGQDQGDFVDQGLYLSERYGIMTEQDYGISGTYQFKWATGYDKYYKALQYRTQEVLTFADSIPLMKRWLYDAGDGSAVGGVLTFSAMSRGWDIDDDYQGPSLTGYRSLLKGLATDGAHALTIAGYDDTVVYTDAQGTPHTGAFIVVNSWGTHSHDRGRFYLPYDFFRDARVPEQQLGSTVEAIRVRLHRPLVVFRLALDFSSRNDLSFGLATESDVDERGIIGSPHLPGFLQPRGRLPHAGTIHARKHRNSPGPDRIHDGRKARRRNILPQYPAWFQGQGEGHGARHGPLHRGLPWGAARGIPLPWHPTSGAARRQQPFQHPGRRRRSRLRLSLSLHRRGRQRDRPYLPPAHGRRPAGQDTLRQPRHRQPDHHPALPNNGITGIT